MNPPNDRDERFTAAYRAAYDDLLRFVQRRTDAGAEDVVAEAMTVAWRRVDELPAGLDDARAWLFGIARHCLLNRRRTHRRLDALEVRLAGTARLTTGDAADAVAARVDLARAWAGLRPGEQEALALAVFEGLDSARAGRVLGVSATAYRLRLSRARAALRRALDTPAGAPAAAPPPTARRRLQGAATASPTIRRPPDTAPVGPALTSEETSR